MYDTYVFVWYFFPSTVVPLTVEMNGAFCSDQLSTSQSLQSLTQIYYRIVHPRHDDDNVVDYNVSVFFTTQSTTTTGGAASTSARAAAATARTNVVEGSSFGGRSLGWVKCRHCGDRHWISIGYRQDTNANWSVGLSQKYHLHRHQSTRPSISTQEQS
jgi:hypothetical protein